MSMQIKIIAGVALLGGGFFAADRYDVHTNYTPGEATITDVSTVCRIEKRGRKSKSRIVDKETGEVATMDCAIAPDVAREFGYDEDDIRRDVTLKYRYESPVDGEYYRGTHEDRDARRTYEEGDTLPLRMHKEEPGKSRVFYG